MFDSKTSGGSNLSTVGGIMSGLGTIANAGIGIANYYQQAKQMAYERQVQMVSWAREDDAVQRRVKDLQAAGLSPVLAAGSAAGSGPVVQTHAPQMSAMPDMSQTAKTYMDLITQKQQIAMSEQQMQMIEKQIEKINSDITVNNINALRGMADTQLINSKKTGQDYDNLIKYVDAINSNDTGIGHDSSVVGRTIKDAYGVVNQIKGVADPIKRQVSASTNNATYYYNNKTQKWEKKK